MSASCPTCVATPIPEPVVDTASEVERERICQAVLNRLGRPVDLHSVKAVRVFADHWRVNVYRVVGRETPAGLLMSGGADFIPSVRITDSFFLVHGSVDGVAKRY